MEKSRQGGKATLEEGAVGFEAVDRDAVTESLRTHGQAPKAPSRGLVVVHDGLVLHRVVPILARVTLGRGAAADVQLDDAAVSRMHAAIEPAADGLSIGGLGGGSGVFVNGRAIVGEHTVRSGDVIRLGRSLLVAVDDATAQEPLHWSTEIAGRTTDLVGTWCARRTLDFAERFASTTLAVLVLGATGTGKEVVATSIHRLSKRTGPLVAINCATLPRELAESQLFGHKKGAFSGAVDNHQGTFAAAHGGTLFLDEVGDLSAAMQAKLLRVLETGEVTPLGSNDPVKVDVRVIAATCQDLTAAIRQERFRDDLYHRLNGVSIWMPPLAERNEEIGLLVAHFLGGLDAGRLLVSSQAMEAMLTYDWPGNVRQLRQVVHAAAIRAAARGSLALDLEDLHLPAPEHTAETPVERSVAPSLEQTLAAMRRNKGNVSRAARELGAHRAQIYRLLEEHGLRSEQFR